ncbi:solute carrier family 22 member 10-like isoform X2 [Castor canadensis]
MKPEKCRRFIHPQWQLLHLNETFSNSNEPDIEPCLDGWVYDQSYFPSTIVTEWDLVCDYQSMKSVVQFLYMTGMLVGTLVCSPLSDRFGRKVMVKWCLLLVAISGTCTAFASSFFIYCSLRFLAGFSSMVILANSRMLAIEWTRIQSRDSLLTLINSIHGIGITVLGGLAFIFRKWRTLPLVVAAPCFLFFLSSRWLVESARWFIATNKPDQGLKALRKVAQINGIKNSEETLNVEVVRSTMQEELQAAQTKTTLWDLFRNTNMRKRICLLFVVSLGYTIPLYGLTFNIQHLGNNIFLYQVLFGAICFLAQIFSLLVLNHVSRRVSQILFLILEGLFILVHPFLPEEIQALRVALACVAVGFGTAAINSATIHITELIPTVLRARTLGLVTMVSRIGAALAPLLMTLRIFSTTIPWIIYGVIPIIACFAVFCLPETKNLPLIDNLQDVNNENKFTRKVKKNDSSIKITKF